MAKTRHDMTRLGFELVHSFSSVRTGQCTDYFYFTLKPHSKCYSAVGSRLICEIYERHQGRKSIPLLVFHMDL